MSKVNTLVKIRCVQKLTLEARKRIKKDKHKMNAFWRNFLIRLQKLAEFNFFKLFKDIYNF